MRRYLLLFLCAFITFTAIAQKGPSKKDWIQLFNGKNLQDWRIKITGFPLGENYNNTFRVRNHKMVVSYDQYQAFDNHFGHIFYYKPFSYYRLRVIYRFLGEQAKGGPEWALRNSGAMLHCQSPESMGKDQDFPISIEEQYLGGLGDGARSTANLCTPGTNVVMNGQLITEHCISSTSKTYDGDQWVTVEALVLGDSVVRHFVNGEMVLEYEQPQMGGEVLNHYDKSIKIDGKLLTSGYIALQAESHPIEFRKVELLNLEGCMDPKAKNYKPYYVKADNTQCVYK